MTTKPKTNDIPAPYAGFKAFTSDQKWTKMSDSQTTIALLSRWERASDLPGRFIRSSYPGVTAYVKPDASTSTGFAHVESYLVTIEDGCTCPDADPLTGKAPYGWCKHRIKLWQLFQVRRARATAVIQKKQRAHHVQ